VLLLSLDRLQYGLAGLGYRKYSLFQGAFGYRADRFLCLRDHSLGRGLNHFITIKGLSITIELILLDTM